jgi:hypothetical protein
MICGYHEYMDRRLLFPAVAITAWAQQPSPSPAATEAETALRARVEQFYQFQVDKKFRQAEAMIAEESKDSYYNGSKPDIKTFSIKEIELLDDNSRARVTLRGKVTVRTPVGAQEFEMPAITSWKIENGEWMWYIDRDIASRSPFGKINPPADTAKGASVHPAPLIDVATLMNQVTVDNMAVALNSSNREQTITVSNNLPGEVSLAIDPPPLDGIVVELEKLVLKTGEKGAVHFRLKGEAKTSGVVKLVVSPLDKVFEIQVHSN